jgi:RNA polymerase sigma factor (sigma-70 family)
LFQHRLGSRFDWSEKLAESTENQSYLSSQDIQTHLTALVRRFLYRFNLPDAAADDLRQQVVLKLISLPPERLNEITNLEAYVYTVALNEARRLRERSESHVQADLDEAGNTFSDHSVNAQRLESGILLRELWNALDEVDRRVLEFLILGYNDKELALRMGISHDSARKRVSRLRTKLKSLMVKDR